MSCHYYLPNRLVFVPVIFCLSNSNYSRHYAFQQVNSTCHPKLSYHFYRSVVPFINTLPRGWFSPVIIIFSTVWLTLSLFLSQQVGYPCHYFLPNRLVFPCLHYLSNSLVNLVIISLPTGWLTLSLFPSQKVG